MKKKASPNIKEDFKLKPSGLSGKLSGFSHRGSEIIKFFLGLGLLPFVYASSIAFLSEFALIEKTLQDYFWRGIITLVVVYLFIWEPTKIYTKGQKLLEIIFSFFRPLVRIAPYLLPVYAIIIFILYQLLSLAISATNRGGSLPVWQAGASGGKSAWLIQYCLFLLGFAIALHLVFSAKSVRSKKEDFLKGNYIFGFSFVYIINLTLLAFCLNLIFKEFSVVNFFNNSFSIAKNIFYAVLNQLFLR